MSTDAPESPPLPAFEGPVALRYRAGTVEFACAEGQALEKHVTLPEGAIWDTRTACFRAPALLYAPVIMALRRAGIAYEDEARTYGTLEHGAVSMHSPRPYQQKALDAWWRARGQGTVVLPTGAGKTHVAVMAIDKVRRDTLVVVPTLDLLRQWMGLLERAFDMAIGAIGGGSYDVQPITVTTYDSALIHMEHLGKRFGLIVFDEAHHLPGPSYSLSARQCLAPFRLGLTATPERSDGKETDLDTLIGPIVHREEIDVLAGDYLAPYDTTQVTVRLTDDERAEYDSERAIYRGFVQSQGIRFGSKNGWQEFIMRASRSDEGRRALAAYRRQRALALGAEGKVEKVGEILAQHAGERTIIFTNDNDAAYGIARTYLIPVITHQTKVKERKAVLDGFKDGTYTAVVTSRVLNEGVDVPSASVAIVVSGTGSVREHVQRLGRVLRPDGDKRAQLYELVAESTGETYTSERRRQHRAYQ